MESMKIINQTNQSGQSAKPGSQKTQSGVKYSMSVNIISQSVNHGEVFCSNNDLTAFTNTQPFTECLSVSSISQRQSVSQSVKLNQPVISVTSQSVNSSQVNIGCVFSNQTNFAWLPYQICQR